MDPESERQYKYIKHQAADALSHSLASEENNTTLEYDLPLLAMEAAHDLADTHIYVIDTNINDINPMDGNHTEVALKISGM